jgi:hypothetical protein
VIIAEQRKTWTFDNFMKLFPPNGETLFPNGPHALVNHRVWTWQEENQAKIRSLFPFIIWAGEINWLDTIEKIRVIKLESPELTLWPAEVGGIVIDGWRAQPLKPEQKP